MADGSDAAIVCVGAEEHRFLIADVMDVASTKGPIILEPVARNTTAVMALAALHATSEDQVLLFCPADGGLRVGCLHMGGRHQGTSGED